MTEKRYSRHEGLFGVDGQILIEHTRIGMVGIGGLGMQVAEQLAYAASVTTVLSSSTSYPRAV